MLIIFLSDVRTQELAKYSLNADSSERAGQAIMDSGRPHIIFV